MVQRFVTAVMRHETNTFSPIPTSVTDFGRVGPTDGPARDDDEESADSRDGEEEEEYGYGRLLRLSLPAIVNESAPYLCAVSYTHLTLPTKREV